MATANYDFDGDQTFSNTETQINNNLAAIVSNNSSATDPSPTFAYMWWADTDTGFLKQRNAANSGWISILTLSTGQVLNLTAPPPIGSITANSIKGSTFETNNGTAINEFSIDGTLSGNSDDVVATEKATKTYVDSKIPRVFSDQITSDFTINPGTNTFGALTGLSVAINSKAASSKILVSGFVTIANSMTGQACVVRIKANGVVIGQADADGAATRGISSAVFGRVDAGCSVPFQFLHSPGTTATQTYTVEAAPLAATSVIVNEGTQAGTGAALSRTTSVITAQEVIAQ